MKARSRQVRTVGNQRGMTLIEIMIVVGISLVLTVAVMDQMGFMQKSVTQSRLRLVIQELSVELRSLLTVGNSVFESLSLNENLERCVNGGTVGGCEPNGIAGGAALDLVLTQPGTGQQIGGPAGAPVFYTIDGTPCPAATTCPIRVVTTWRGDCPAVPGPVEGPCERATRIELSYTIDVNPDWNHEGPTIRPAQFSVIRPVQSIVTGVLSCPAGEVLRGFNFDGSLICGPG